MSKPRLVVLGNGMAAARLLERLTAKAHGYQITVVGDEPLGAYNRIQLSNVLAGEMPMADTVTHPPSWYAQQGITLMTGQAATQLDRTARRVTLTNGVQLDYDHLVLATGSRAFLPPTPGAELAGVVGFRTQTDVLTMLQHAHAGGDAVVIGGGILGLEAAYGLLKRGMRVRVVHRSATLMERQLDAEGAAILQARLEKLGVGFSLATQAVAYEGHDTVKSVRLANGEVHPAQLVVVAAGIVPNAALGHACGLGGARGIAVDDQLATNDPNISAVGECAEHRNTCYGLVAPLYEQAEVLAQRLCGQRAHYTGSLLSTRLKVTGLEVFSAGDFIGDSGCEVLEYREKRRGVYRRLVLRAQRLVGLVLIGDSRDATWYFGLLQQGEPLHELRQTLLFGPLAEQAA